MIQSGESGSLPCSGPSSSASSSASLHSPPGSPMHGYYQEDFVRSQGFREVSEGKLVTLEELVHMRKVLTDASLENLPLASSIKDDVKNGKVERERNIVETYLCVMSNAIHYTPKKEIKIKMSSLFLSHFSTHFLFPNFLQVCFVCRKTRFSLFGSWWHSCKLCRRTVCTKCCMKVIDNDWKRNRGRNDRKKFVSFFSFLF